MTTDRRSKYLSLIIPIILSLMTLAVSWGATRMEVSNTKEDVTAVKVDVKDHGEKIHAVETHQAVEDERWGSIQKQVKEINESLKELAKQKAGR